MLKEKDVLDKAMNNGKRVDRLRQRQSRLEQREIRRTSNRQRQRQRRLMNKEKWKKTLNREIQRLRRHSDSDLNTDTSYYYMGEMNELCQSLRFPNEKLNRCHNDLYHIVRLSKLFSMSYS